MSTKRIALVALGVAVVVAVVVIVLVLGRGSDDGDPGDRHRDDAGTGTPPVVPDDAWCAGWDTMVAAQGQWVATPTSDSSMALLLAVDELQGLGVPESLDPAGYTELNAVLDDLRASVDPTFTASVAPSEPADVSAGDKNAPFGAWLAQYCAR